MTENSDKGTILFVDDEVSILDIAYEYFTDLGYRVETAENGLKAVALLDRIDPICCFTDINMPEMDGMALAEYIREKNNAIPVVIMTGYPSLDNSLRTLKNGVADYLIKPVNLNQLSLCLNRVLRERELFVKNIMLKEELENKHKIEALNSRLSARVEDLRTLNMIMTRLVSLSTGSEVFDRMVRIAMEITGATYTAFYLTGPAISDPMKIASCISAKDRLPGKTAFDDRLFAEVVKEITADGVSMMVEDNKKAQKLPEAVGSFMGVPLMIRDSIFGVLAIAMNGNNRSFSPKQLYYVSFMSRQASYLVENMALYENIYENLLATLSALVKTVEARDDYTNQHSMRVTALAKAIAQRYGCKPEDIDILDFAGRLHDMGKIGIRDEILLKPASLSAGEFEIIKAHPVIGESIIDQLGLWDREKQIIRHHHEWYDGSGYPDGLMRDEIPILARILSVADVFDAMVTDRPYRREMPFDDVKQAIESESGRQFDPEIVGIFLDLYRENRFSKLYENSPGSP